MRAWGFRIAVLVALGAVAYRIDRPWRFLALVAVAAYLWQWTAFRHRREALRIVRQRRHRLANRLQVVAGWLQLGAVGRAEEALQSLLESESAQVEWFRGLPSHWSYFLVRWDARALERGLYLRWVGIDTLVPTYWMAWMMERRMQQAMTMARTGLVVEFFGTGFCIHIPDRVPMRLPRGWQHGLEGVQCRWGVAADGGTMRSSQGV
ncbi:MAG: hypothetical protein C7B45_08135 [Sulfobacillus acidophilus]|uniref:SpoOB alpha-helical domain-containing protein n=1 Tax=Sulfobacillus acidophilus TaxID=53633 RepID=A0A2T2WIK8_9FIRM|nr:MAG: hypothetical protein C7B45_08135 [Sulfobacillus acidophilus]